MSQNEWIFAGDETGNWDCLHSFGQDAPVGVALVLGTPQTWAKALLQSAKGGQPVLEAFNRPIHPIFRGKYHVKDVLSARSNPKISPDHKQQAESIVCRHLNWLVSSSGLGILALGGTVTAMRNHGYLLAQDPAFSRGRCFARLMALMLPFLGDRPTLRPLLELRSEPINTATQVRDKEPKRLLHRQLEEDFKAQTKNLQSYLERPLSFRLDTDFIPLQNRIAAAIAQQAAHYRDRGSTASKVRNALLAIADLACLLARPPRKRFVKLKQGDDHYPAFRYYNFDQLPW